MTRDDQPERMRCPTCGAWQDWSDQCRRCKCDLSLLHQMLRYCRQLHRTCLVQLRDGETNLACHTARRYHALMPTPTSRRLLAVCSAINHDMKTAVELANRK